jgi:ankyrin repeat protein
MTPETQSMLDAIAAGDLAEVRRLVGIQPGLAAARDATGVSAALLARYRGRADIAEALLVAGAPLDVFDAAAAGRLDALHRILGSDPGAARAVSADGFTALHLAAFFSQREAAAALLAAGAAPDACSENSMRVRPLHSATAMRAAGIVELLLAGGADPNLGQQGGVTPLHEAAAHDDLATLEALLAHGARAEMRMDDGRTALDLAREHKATRAVALLEAVPRA